MPARFCRIVLLFVSGLLAACSSPGHFQPQPPSSPELGQLYLYRPAADNPGLQPLRLSYPEVLIDGQSVGLLKFNTHFPVELAAGQHRIRVTGLTPDASWEPRDIEQTFNLAPGEIKYLKLDVQYQLDQMGIGDSAPKYRLYLTPVRAADALYEIRDTSPRSR